MDFTILIPTLNRAEMLRHALASALAQDHSSFEVLVSNNASTDHTTKVLQENADPRLRIVQTDRLLSMPEHWEFAIQQARGEWVLVLCDDDALFPNALTHLHRLTRDHSGVELIHFGQLIYFYEGMRGAGKHVDVPDKLPLHVQSLDSKRKLQDIYWRMGFNFPKMLNCATHKNLLERIRHRHGRLFSEWAPDFSSGAKLLANTATHLRTGPLMLWGENMESYGAGSWRDPEHLLKFLRQFSTFNGRLERTPYPDWITVYNVVYDTLMNVRDELGETGGALRIDPVRYRRLMLSDLKQYVSLGFQAFEEPLKTVRGDLNRCRIEQWIHPGQLLTHAASKLGGGSEAIRRGLLKARTHWVSGKKQRQHFENIHDAATAVSQRVTLL
jgi:glycosyltransferase involved in cell wall biosynthesis